MRSLLQSTVAVIALISSLSISAAQLSRSIVAPFSEKPLLSSEPDKDLFADFPAYDTSDRRQIWIRNGWKGKEDFLATVRCAWTKSALYIRFDMRDDVFTPGDNLSLANATSDFIMIKLVAGSVGPKDSPDAFKILLLPNPVANTCKAKVFADPVSLLTIGKPETKVFVTGRRRYTLIVKQPLKLWELQPASGRSLSLQMIFGDSDRKGRIDHMFGLFPRIDPSEGFLRSMGQLHFTDYVWAKLSPAKAKFESTKMDLLLDWGNLGEDELELRAEILDKGGKVVRGFDKLMRLRPGASAQDIKLSVDLAGLPAQQKYTVRTKAGVFYDPATFSIVLDSKRANAVLCPDFIVKRPVRERRRLAAYRDQQIAKEALRYMAGGGEVLWHIGEYDASSAEFPEIIRPDGPVLVEIPTNDTEQIPWALFGGIDLLDTMNEPLVLKFRKSVFEGTERFAPDYPPTFTYLDKDQRNRKLANTSKRLLLIGLVCTRPGGEQNPLIRITGKGNRLLMERRLQPSASRVPGQLHSYVLRLWLDGKEDQVSIANVTHDGPRVEIDFLALVGPSKKPLAIPDKTPRIEFLGSHYPKHFNRILATNLFFLKNYMLDLSGRTYPSIPGGRNPYFSLRDHSLIASELASWCQMRQAKDLVSSLPLALRWASKRERETHNIGYPMMVNAVYNYWRKAGRERNIVERYWHSIITPQMQELISSQSISQMGLVSSSGEFGTSQEQSGSTVPLIMAARSAIRSAIVMAKARDYPEAEEWEQLDKALAENFERNLVSPPGGQRIQSAEVFPAAHGLPQQAGFNTNVPNGAWIYARDANREPLGYIGNTRVFDSPQLFAGIPFWFDSYGYDLSLDQVRQIKETDQYLRTGLILKNDAFTKHNIVTYKGSEEQLWLIAAALAVDNLAMGTKMLNAMIAYNYDEFCDIPAGADVEISPYGLEGKFNLNDDGTNKGGSLDECGALPVTCLLKLARQIAGIDDHDQELLKITPRLPDRWQGVKVTDWIVCHNFDRDQTATFNMTYERTASGYSLDLQGNRPLKELKVRIGPFPGGARRVLVSTEGSSKHMATVLSGGLRWVYVTQKRVMKTKITVRSSIF